MLLNNIITIKVSFRDLHIGNDIHHLAGHLCIFSRLLMLFLCLMWGVVCFFVFTCAAVVVLFLKMYNNEPIFLGISYL